MQVQVSGKHVDVGQALRTRVTDDITTAIGKYFDRGGDADVVISREGHSFRADCAVTLASGQNLQSHALGGDAHAAFSQALHKIETRIRRYKRRLKSHTNAAAAKNAETAAFYVLRAPDDDEESEGDDWGHDDAHPAGAPTAMIIAETQKDVRSMTVSMAVMELDLTEAPALVFRNVAHGGLSVVWRRPDGNIGWIDPERTRPANANGAGHSKAVAIGS